MKQQKINAPFIWLAVLLLTGAFAPTYAQTTPQTQAAPGQPQNNFAQPQNLPTALNFTPQQAELWRQINREFRVQEMTATTKAREARLALNTAMESPTPNEEVIKQRAKELADAQSAVTQLQALRQARVLQILTPDQRVKLKEIRERAQILRRQQQQQANGLGEGQIKRNPEGQIKRNPNAQILTPAQRKALRLQQQKQKP